ncbi:MAG TPA: DUF2889 domain-containing protein [Rhizobacter sp.]|nr:DUF2889 domain-containing protein [Rhizobacter sp.]
MALPPAAPERQLKHSRRIDVHVYARGNGLWEVDALISDIKTRAAELADRVLPAGEPIHDMLLRLVIDEAFNVLEAGSETRGMPYPGACDNHGDAYGRLVGLNLMRGFRFAVAERLGGVAGCTHLTELTQVLPTAVIQAFAGDVINTQGDGPDAKQPFQLDRCHALRTDGHAVRTYYPRWYKPAPKTKNPTAFNHSPNLSEESPR